MVGILMALRAFVRGQWSKNLSSLVPDDESTDHAHTILSLCVTKLML